MDVNPLRCCQCVKDRNFESNSQRSLFESISFGGCCQCVKDRNFESNSQLSTEDIILLYGCCQCVKDRNFESNSQQISVGCDLTDVVVSVSKIEISKAIHNTRP